MKLKPVLTEKSMDEAKKGNYTFLVEYKLNKFQIRNLISEVFGVNVRRVRTMKVPGELKKTIKGKNRIILPQKKAIVSLTGKEKIDLFEAKKK